jgi:hypothetical protein
MTIVGAAFLGAMGLAYAAVHVEHDRRLRLACMHTVNPGAGQIGQRGKIALAGQPRGLEAANLARRSSATVQPAAIHDRTHRRIVRQAIGVVHVLIASKATEH